MDADTVYFLEDIDEYRNKMGLYTLRKNDHKDPSFKSEEIVKQHAQPLQPEQFGCWKYQHAFTSFLSI